MPQFGPASYNPQNSRYEGFPLSGWVTDDFHTWSEWRKARGLGWHTGVDISDGTVDGSPIRAPAPGIVRYIEGNPDNSAGLGYYVTLEHDDHMFTAYCHLMERCPLPQNSRVNRGDVLGRMGHTGVGSGPHLHWMFAATNNGGMSRTEGGLWRALNFITMNPSDAVGPLPPPPPPPPAPVPPPTPGPADGQPAQVYIIKSGDILGRLANDWGCTVDDICRLNSIADPDRVFAGQWLSIPPRR